MNNKVDNLERKKTRDLRQVLGGFDNAIIRLGEFVYYVVLYIFKLILRQKLSWRPLALAVIIGLLAIPAVYFNAFEACVINVTAQPINDAPMSEPAGGQFCDSDIVEINLTTTVADAAIMFTIDGSNPSCNPHGFVYEDPFELAASAIVKARTCHDDRESAINSWVFIIGPEYCDEPASPAAVVHIRTTAYESNDLLNSPASPAANNEDDNTGEEEAASKTAETTPANTADETSGDEEPGDEEEGANGDEEDEEDEETGSVSVDTISQVIKQIK